MEVTSAPRYLSTLVALGIIERACPYGENPETSRKGIYRILEASFAFWFRFVMPRTSAIEDGMGALVLNAVGEDALATYMGPRFERVCREWLRECAIARELPLDVIETGSWWGTDPSRRETTDIDVLVADDRKRLLIGECKYRNSFDETETIEALIKRRSLVRGYEASWFYLFSRWPVHESTQLKYANNNVGFVTLDGMYACS